MQFPTVQEIANELKPLRKFWKQERPTDDEYLDVRLQVDEKGSWSLHEGDSCYDTDHHGFWGSSCLSGEESPTELLELAADLIDQCEEHAAQCAE